MNPGEKTNASEMAGAPPQVAIGDGLTYVPPEFALFQAGYQAGVISGREEGYVAGYKAGREDKGVGSREQGVGAGRRRTLLGLPCAHCGCFFYSDEKNCPRCKKSREQEAGSRKQGPDFVGGHDFSRAAEGA